MRGDAAEGSVLGRAAALGRATALAEPLLDQLRSAPDVSWASPAGSLRRGQDTVGDIEIVAACEHPEHAMSQLLEMPESARWLHHSERRLYLLVDRTQI